MFTLKNVALYSHFILGGCLYTVNTTLSGYSSVFVKNCCDAHTSHVNNNGEYGWDCVYDFWCVTVTEVWETFMIRRH